MYRNCFGGRPALPLAATMSALLFSYSPLHAATSTFDAANWAGYVVEYTGSGSTPQSGVANYVSAIWTVPTALPPLSKSASASSCISAVWVGLDGFNDATVEQVGITSEYDGGLTSYSAWYDMYPSGEVNVFSVQPGDSITASVQYNPPGNPGTFLLSLTDNTQNKSFPPLYETNASAQLSSAEWIVEAPGLFRGDAPLPNIGSVTFTGATATLGTETGPVDTSDWQTTDVVMVPSSQSYPPFVNAMAPEPPLDITSGGSTTSTIVVNQIVPEPSSIALLAAALGCVCAAPRLRRWSERVET
jgi:hypothetical protein